MEYEDVIRRLEALADPEAVKGMARFGINPENTFGVSMPNLRNIAKESGKDHGLAQELWASGIHEARILAGMVDDPKAVTGEQMELWVKDFDSWDVCDQVCMNLFDKVPLAGQKVFEWAERDEEFVKRAAFALIACLAWYDKTSGDEEFTRFLPVIVKGATDAVSYTHLRAHET